MNLSLLITPSPTLRQRLVHFAANSFRGAKTCAACLLAALLFSSQADAQADERTSVTPERPAATGSIEGSVSPAHSHPFTLATARIPDLGLSTSIAEDGTFRFEQIRPGTYAVEVRVPTLGSRVQQTEVLAGEVTRIEVEIVAGSHFEEVVVSATGDPREQLDLATAATSLNGQELQLRLEASLGETLAQEPGISSTFFGPAASRPIIRGLSGDRVRVMEGGIGSGDASSVSVDHAATTDPLQAERIEVLRGPATLLYGSSAIGGAVNVIDERIPTTRSSATVTGTVDLRAGTNSDERAGAISLGGGSGDWAWHLDTSLRESDDYEIPGFAALEEEEHGEEEHDEEEERAFGFVPNSDLESQSVRLGATRFFGDRGFFGVAFSGFESEYGLPPGGHHHEEGGEEHDEEEHNEEGEGEEFVRIDMEQRRVDLRGELRQPFGPFQATKLRLGATDYEHVELEGSEIGTRFFNDYLETRLEVVQKEAQRGAATHRGSLGLQFSDRDLEAIGAEAFIPRSLTERVAGFTFQEIETGAVTWQFGARFETQDVDLPDLGLGRTHDGISGSLGLVYRLDDSWALAGSVARSVKLPSPEELFSDGPHVASQAFEIGDASLNEEEALGLDLALRKTEGKLTGELSLFRQDFTDFIFQAFTGDEEDGLPVVLWSQGDAEFYGAELQARVELLDRDGHHLHFELVSDLVEAQLDAGDNLPRIPPFRLGGGLHYHSEHWSGNVEVRWTDDQDEVASNETPSDGYTFLNASVSRRFLLGGQILDVLLRGRNLTDEEARIHTSFLKAAAPLPGRDVALSLRLWF